MAAFKLDADTVHPADFSLLRDGGVTLFSAPSVLTGTEQELIDLGYASVRLDAGRWRGDDDLHNAFASALHFPDYYGRNMNALNDCLYDVAHGDYGWDPDVTGLAVSVAGFDDLASRDRDLAVATANAMARATRTGLLFGHRLLWLLQVTDRRLQLGPLGCITPSWNQREWFDANRR